MPTRIFWAMNDTNAVTFGRRVDCPRHKVALQFFMRDQSSVSPPQRRLKQSHVFIYKHGGL